MLPEPIIGSNHWTAKSVTFTIFAVVVLLHIAAVTYLKLVGITVVQVSISGSFVATTGFSLVRLTVLNVSL